MTAITHNEPEKGVGKTWRMVLGILALLAWGLLIGVSLSANASFALTLGHSEFEQRVLAAGAIASDIFKALAPLAFFWAIYTRRWWPATAAAMVWMVTMTFSLFAATGFVSGERIGMFDRNSAKIEQAADAKDEARRIEANNGWLTESAKRPSTVIAAEIAANEADSRWRNSAECTKAKGTTEDWCRVARGLYADLEASKAREVQEYKASKLKEKANEVTAKSADYQVSALSQISGWTEGSVLLGLIGLTVALIEIGSSFGLTLALSLLSGGKTNGGVGASVDRAFRVITGRKEEARVTIAEKPDPAPAAATTTVVRAPEVPASVPFAQEPVGPAVARKRPLHERMKPVEAPVVQPAPQYAVA